MVLRPASAVRWYLPSRSMILTCFCGTILIAFIRTTSRNTATTKRTIQIMRVYLQDDAVGADDRDARAGRQRRCAPRRPVLAADVDAARADAVDVVRDDAVLADQLLGARRHARPLVARRASGRSTASDTTRTTANTTIWTGVARRQRGRDGGGERGHADEHEPEMRNGHFDDRRDDRQREPGKRRPFEQWHREGLIIRIPSSAGLRPQPRARRSRASARLHYFGVGWPMRARIDSGSTREPATVTPQCSVGPSPGLLPRHDR